MPTVAAAGMPVPRPAETDREVRGGRKDVSPGRTGPTSSSERSRTPALCGPDGVLDVAQLGVVVSITLSKADAVAAPSQYLGQVSALTGDDPRPVGEPSCPPRARQPRSTSERRWDQIRWALLVCWLVAVTATVLTGERASTWAEVRTLVATGEVNAVRVVGELTDRGTGYSVVEVHWRRDPIRYRNEVVQVLGNGGRGPDAAHESATGVLHEPPSSRLTGLQPELQVTRDQDRSNSEPLLGWMVPSWLAFLAALLFVPGLAVLIAGPTPGRATRWACPGYRCPRSGGSCSCWLPGPLPAFPHPRSRHRRLTGGWAFLLSLPLMGILAPYRW